MLLVKRRKTARTPLAAMEAAHLSQPVAGAASLIRRSRTSPDHPRPIPRRLQAVALASWELPKQQVSSSLLARRRRRFLGRSLAPSVDAHQVGFAAPSPLVLGYGNVYLPPGSAQDS